MAKAPATGLPAILRVCVLTVILTACAPTPAPVASARPDPTAEIWYGETARQLAALVHEAEGQYAGGKQDQAAALIQRAEPLRDRLLLVPKPTLAATEAASDLDQLYGQMLLGNRHYGWARLLFQKNLARWKHWQPQTEETERRLKQAEKAIADCDRHLAE